MDHALLSLLNGTVTCCAIFNSYFWCTIHIGLNLSTQWLGNNIFGNRLAPIRDIAVRFSTLQHLCYICNDGTHSTERYKNCMHF